MKQIKSFPESKEINTNVDSYWDKIRSESYDGSFDKTTGLLTKKINLNKGRKISPMKKFISEHKYKIAFALFLIFAVAACNYPVSQENTLGYGISFTANSSDAEDVSQSIKNVNWPGNSNVNSSGKTINGTSVTEYNVMLQGADESAVMKCRAELEKIKGINSLKIFPITENVSRPVYSALLYSFFKVDVKSSGKTQEEIVREIEQQLKDNKFGNYKVGFENSDGKSKLSINLSGDPGQSGKSVEVRVSGDGKEEVVKLKTVAKEINKNMTDDEIRQKVISDNPEGNLKPEDIKIERDGDKINVKVEKEEVK
mgnify:CR=1 FL=1